MTVSQTSVRNITLRLKRDYDDNVAKILDVCVSRAGRPDSVAIHLSRIINRLIPRLIRKLGARAESATGRRGRISDFRIINSPKNPRRIRAPLN